MSLMRVEPSGLGMGRDEGPEPRLQVSVLSVLLEVLVRARRNVSRASKATSIMSMEMAGLLCRVSEIQDHSQFVLLQ